MGKKKMINVKIWTMQDLIDEFNRSEKIEREEKDLGVVSNYVGEEFTDDPIWWEGYVCGLKDAGVIPDNESWAFLNTFLTDHVSPNYIP